MDLGPLNPQEAGPGPGAAPARGAPTPREMTRLRQAAQDFEGIFLSHILKTMRGSVPKGGLFGSGSALRAYQGLADDELGRALAQRGGIGLAEVLERDLSRSLVPGKPPSSSGPRRSITESEPPGRPQGELR